MRGTIGTFLSSTKNHALFPYYHAHLSVVWFLLSFHCFWRCILKFIFPQGLPFTHLYNQNLKKNPTHIKKPTYDCIFSFFLNFKT